ncbi:MAG: hypothetical protein ACR2IE_11590 [Candidatus Sumerlaeaceae bacterium]
MQHARVSLILLLFSLAGMSGALQVAAPYLAKSPVLDGRVSPAEQAGSARVGMILAGGLDKPKQVTSAYIFMNDQGLYVGFVCEESAMNSIVQKTVNENGAVFEDDSVQLFLSPNREATKTNYTHFAVNTAGIKYSNNMQDDRPVEGWQAAASRGTKSWEAEMFIPFSAIRGETDVPYWRMNLARERAARPGEKEEISAWINPGASLHNYKRFGFVQFKLPTQTPTQPGTITAAGASTTPTVTAIATTTTLGTAAAAPSAPPARVTTSTIFSVP